MNNQEMLELCKETCNELNIPYTENSLGISAKIKKISAEGSLIFNFIAEDSGHDYMIFIVQGVLQNDYNGEDVNTAIEKLKLSKIVFDSLD